MLGQGQGAPNLFKTLKYTNIANKLLIAFSRAKLTRASGVVNNIRSQGLPQVQQLSPIPANIANSLQGPKIPILQIDAVNPFEPQ